MRVKVRTDRPEWVTGFVIGADGEFVFGLERAPTAALTVRTDEGIEHAGRLLGFDRTIGLGVGIVDHLDRLPLRAQRDDPLHPETWVVILGHDKKGRAEPHAGVVASAPQRGKDGRRAAWIDVPGAPGHPVLAADGALVGIAIARGRRRVRVMPIREVMPFLSRVVLGGS